MAVIRSEKHGVIISVSPLAWACRNWWFVSIIARRNKPLIISAFSPRKSKTFIQTSYKRPPWKKADQKFTNQDANECKPSDPNQSISEWIFTCPYLAAGAWISLPKPGGALNRRLSNVCYWDLMKSIYPTYWVSERLKDYPPPFKVKKVASPPWFLIKTHPQKHAFVNIS